MCKEECYVRLSVVENVSRSFLVLTLRGTYTGSLEVSPDVPRGVVRVHRPAVHQTKY